MNKYTERLYQEWLQHGKIIIAVDFDDTISPWGFKSKEDLERLDRTIQILRVAYETGAYIVIFSACSPDRHIEIQEYCEKIKLPINSINANPIDLPYGKHGKVFANIFIDDRAGLNEALDMLETCMYKIRGNNAIKLTAGEESPYTT